MPRANGFTLAEVLITLGIIGVVAAMTLPLLAHHQKSTTVTKLKEIYSILSQAKTMTEQEWGTFDTQLSSEKFITTYFAPHLKISGACRSQTECYGNSYPLGIDRKTKIKIPSYIAILPNGAYFGTYSVPGGSIFYIDINGKAQPNYSGRDIFYFYLVNTSKIVTDGDGCRSALERLKSFDSGLFPGGYASCYIPHASLSRNDIINPYTTHRACSHNAREINNGGTGGDACAALIMRDNWKISSDYPW